MHLGNNSPSQTRKNNKKPVCFYLLENHKNLHHPTMTGDLPGNLIRSYTVHS